MVNNAVVLAIFVKDLPQENLFKEVSVMRILRGGVLTLFIIVFLAFSFIFVREKITTDTTIPVINVEGEIIDVSLKATDEELLKGISAYDEKDGDLTSEIIIESVSRFIEPGVSRVTYAVCDNDNNIATATRKIRYKGYEAPKFYLSEALCYSVYETPNLKKAVTARDSLMGDITSDMILTSEDYTRSVTGVFTINARVTTPKGDTATLDLPLIIEDRSEAAPEIELKEYIVYANKGDKIDFEEYLVKATDIDEKDITDDVTIETKINMKKEGTYLVHYYAEDGNENKGHTVLVVVVR